MHQSREAFWWSLFSAGGVMTALFIPAFIVVTGVLVPRLAASEGDIAAWEQVRATVAWWPVRLALVPVLALGFFHCAHRVRHVLIDLGLRGAAPVLALVCYGGAATGAGAAGWLLWRLTWSS